MIRATLLLAAVLVACGGGSKKPIVPASEKWDGPWTPPPVDGDADVVATVDDAKIYVADVERQARERRIPAKQALDELITQELLATEARRRGLVDDPEVVAARKQARARLLVARGFGPTFLSPDDVPMSDVERVYNDPKLHAFFDHERYQEVVYFRVRAPEKTSTQAEIEAAKKLAEEARASIASKQPKTAEDFEAAARAFVAEKNFAFDLVRISTTRHNSTIEPFAAAAFALKEIGDISPPTWTGYGWDLLFLYNILPERHDTLAQAAPEIRQKIFEDSRRGAFIRWYDKLASRHHVEKPGAEKWLPRIPVVGPSM